MNDKLYYFSRSADKPPGKGTNEHISNPDKYLELSRISDWRKMLSNFWVSSFEVGGVRWNTVEHMFQGYKINIANPQLGFTFSLNSGSPLSRASGDEAQRNRKLSMLTPEQLRQWEIMKNDVMYAALYAKFSQNPELKRVLLLTQDAELWHGTPRAKAGRQYSLEFVRASLLAKDMNASIIPFEMAGQKLSNNEIVNFTLDPRLQPLAGQQTQNNMIILIGRDNSIYLVSAIYDQSTNQILPPK